MAERRFEQLPEARKDEILDLAAQHFAESGFARTSFNKLLKELGIGKSSAYYYFLGKDDLFSAVLERCTRRYLLALGEMEPPTDAATFWAFVTKASYLGFKFMRNDPTTARILHAVRVEPHLLNMISSEQSGPIELGAFYLHLASLGQTLGVVRTDIEMELLVHAVQGLSTSFEQWFILHPSDEEALADTFTDMMKRLAGT